ncbi:hypothetical protein ASPVEDRAFT_47678 [Aspergillus versicolor CBS 583.65]|uniref:Chitin-binding type-2 domain-containing protein n=1 Tax=Aspergillus versicolor CBS 583.65 TaxID=1036611 RepID=A0A1L9Q432_ASPVE|nr:uncharacterized protein ASPVEDRAFT_47678 [Aspergillus versicolor CBS 583.65]OJJ08535.1 hypothetical protein ASPVEDRAFT_47678 [Aspergillus versicolor CBS 583.65]
MHLSTMSIVFASVLAAVSARPPPTGHPNKLPPCKPGHYWPDHRDCHSFFECDAGHQPVRKTCGPGTAYVWETGVCHHEDEVPSCRYRASGYGGFPDKEGHGGSSQSKEQHLHRD